MPDRAAVCGIDLGGTKIETKLFDERLSPLGSRQAKTPHTSYEDLLDAVLTEVDWAMEQAQSTRLPLGIGLPGLIDARSDLALTANIPATGKPLARDLSDRIGRTVVIENDCKCFALSEAVRGAGAGHHSVVGLILGTGLGGGHCIDGTLFEGRNNVAGEVGHISLPAHLVQRFDLPIVDCGCGRHGCLETYLSGRGITRLDAHLHGKERSAPDLLAQAAEDVFDIWYELLGELLHNIQLTIDPECIVLGGGLSNLPGIETRAADALAACTLPSLIPPEIKLARFGANSGAEGAAILALQKENELSHDR